MSGLLVYAIRGRYDPTMEYRYVGLTKRGTLRFKEHLREALNPNGITYNLPKTRWMRKHYNAVEFDILETCSDWDSLVYTEVKWIHILESRGHRLLNLTVGGDGTPGWNPSDEFRKNQSERMMGNKNPMFGRSGELAPGFGRVVPEEFKTYLSGIRSGEGNPFYGKKHSAETLAVISNKLVGDKNPAAKLSNADTRTILQRRDNGERAVDLAIEYGVHRDTIDRAYKRAKRQETV